MTDNDGRTSQVQQWRLPSWKAAPTEMCLQAAAVDRQ